MKVVVRGESNKYSNQANSQIPKWALPLLFILVGGLFFGLGLWVMISEKVFSSGDSDALFVSVLCTILGGIAIVAGIYIFFKSPRISNTFDLMQSGHCVKLPIVAIEDADCYLNDIPGYYVVCQNLNDEIGCLDVYRSDVIYNIHCANLKPGDLIPVYVDWRDPNRFYMDIDGYEKAENPDESVRYNINNTIF